MLARLRSKNNFLIVASAAITSVFVTAFVFVSIAQAGIWTGAPNNVGYFTRTNVYYNGLSSDMCAQGPCVRVVPSGLAYSYSTSAFIQDLQNKYNSGGQNATGVAFIVNTMLGNGFYNPGSKNISAGQWSDLTQRVQTLENQGRINWNQYVCNMGTSYGSDFGANDWSFNTYDVAYNSNWNQCDSAIVMDTGGGTRYAMFHVCGNPTGDSAPLPSENFSLEPSLTSVSPTTAEGGSSATIRSQVVNGGTTTSRDAVWRFTRFVLDPGEVIPGGPVTNTTAPTTHFGGNSNQATDFDNVTPDPANRYRQFGVGTYTMPVRTDTVPDVQVGSRVCYALSVQPYRHDNTGWRHSAPRCMTITKTPKVQVWGGDLQAGKVTGGSTPTSTIQTSVTVRQGVAYTPPYSQSMITGLWQTGVDDNGQKLRVGANDPHWEVKEVLRGSDNARHCQEGPFPRPATMVDPTSPEISGGSNLVWRLNLTNAGWISTYSDAIVNDPTRMTRNCTNAVLTNNGDPATFSRGPVWVFRLTSGFNVDACVDPRTIRLNMTVAADDEMKIVVNGVDVSSFGQPRAFRQWPATPVSFTTNPHPTAFRTGNNTLEIHVKSVSNALGLLVDRGFLASASCAPVTPGSVYGSWGEYALSSTGATTGMASAGGYFRPQNNLAFCAVSLLTLTNGGNGACTEAATKGNYTFGPSNRSYTEYFRATAALPNNSPNVATLNSGVYSGTGNITLNAATLPRGKSVVINAPNSTVTIQGDITYTNEVMNSIADIPQLVVIANNINIQGGVRRVDAWLIATGTNGNLSTCSDVGLLGNLSSGTCQNQLVVNGPVVAKHLYMQRTYGSGPGNSSGEPAEIFNLRADAYLWSVAQSAASGRVFPVTNVELPPRF